MTTETQEVQANMIPDEGVPQDATGLMKQIPEPGSILSIIQTAVLNKTDVETMRELLAVRREERADQAREAYANAIVMFRRLTKPIIMTGVRDDRVTGGKVHYKYAELTTTIEQITPALDQCGLNPTWRTVKNERDWVEIECVVTHTFGHKESSMSLGAQPQGPSGQTDAQKRCGTITTLKRATLFMVLGLTTKEDDRHLQDAEQGLEPPKPASQALMQPDDAPPDPEKQARNKFHEAACKKLGDGGLKNAFLYKLLANVQQASGMTDVAMCAEWMAHPDVKVAADGTVTVAEA